MPVLYDITYVCCCFEKSDDSFSPPGLADKVSAKRDKNSPVVPRTHVTVMLTRSCSVVPECSGDISGPTRYRWTFWRLRTWPISDQCELRRKIASSARAAQPRATTFRVLQVRKLSRRSGLVNISWRIPNRKLTGNDRASASAISTAILSSSDFDSEDKPPPSIAAHHAQDPDPLRETKVIL
eukprot:CAMPEP_0175060496 /NCGR_PEP_ID=MMETSP0052_2-20121109/13047_1 /TAXON_ID=51329 ORGANISM="Polytomella parva, Strain SAG 63-3" /NCGR_SAMPLE_ID=MMETSP0052_2 /ASSEMBLY_ACC=CAM_ASM_000194 /LENGTH=181 /DNA_ID=CAMNT_0016326217 /DNA_START=475 /DNA_END=1021 /DNA_ORIENTATION=+